MYISWWEFSLLVFTAVLFAVSTCWLAIKNNNFKWDLDFNQKVTRSLARNYIRLMGTIGADEDVSKTEKVIELIDDNLKALNIGDSERKNLENELAVSISNLRAAHSH